MPNELYDVSNVVQWSGGNWHQSIPQLFANNVVASLPDAIASTDTEFRITFTPSLSNYSIDSLKAVATASPFALTLMDDPDAMTTLEIIEVYGYDSVNETFRVNRASEGTLAQGWVAGTQARQWITAGIVRHIQRAVLGALDNQLRLRTSVESFSTDLSALEAVVAAQALLLAGFAADDHTHPSTDTEIETLQIELADLKNRVAANEQAVDQLRGEPAPVFS